MNYNNACKILELSNIFNEKELKHKYYLKALQYHPDKNLDINAKIKFQEVLDAYTFLKDYYKYTDIDIDNDTEDSSELNQSEYLNILDNFINGILNKNKNKSIDVKQFLSILNNRCSELLNHFSKDTLLKMHKFVIQYSDILHINKEIVERLEILIGDFTKNDIIKIINPTIDNLLSDEIYKLEIDEIDKIDEIDEEIKNEIYYIPMWHHELVFELSDASKNLLIVQCEPDLPEYITLDQYNNLYVNISTTIKSILNDNITINIGTKKYIIPVCELYIRRYQRYTFFKQGISSIDTKEIYNVNSRANIYIDICLTDIICNF